MRKGHPEKFTKMTWTAPTMKILVIVLHLVLVTQTATLFAKGATENIT